LGAQDLQTTEALQAIAASALLFREVDTRLQGTGETCVDVGNISSISREGHAYVVARGGGRASLKCLTKILLDKGYTTIKNISEGNYTLHQLFLDGLMAVNRLFETTNAYPTLSNYQKLLIKEYSNAYRRFRDDPHFTPRGNRIHGSV